MHSIGPIDRPRGSFASRQFGQSDASPDSQERESLLQVSGITNEIFKQLETIENDHDASTAAALEAVEKHGEMVVRIIEPRQMGRQGTDAAKKFIAMQVYI